MTTPNDSAHPFTYCEHGAPSHLCRQDHPPAGEEPTPPPDDWYCPLGGEPLTKEEADQGVAALLMAMKRPLPDDPTLREVLREGWAANQDLVGLIRATLALDVQRKMFRLAEWVDDHVHSTPADWIYSAGCRLADLIDGGI